ncbi:hypothetical protein [Microbacterium sp.]|uniref:hypothetical protein n=1 Tax=Microbacterium sp. TaxID=51671 RepID=UPI002FE03AF4
MDLRVSATLAGVLVLAFGLSGCQFGEYTMYSDCTALSEEVSDRVSAELAVQPTIEEFWAGESAYWCSFTVVTELDLDPTDVTRVAVGAQIDDLLGQHGRGINVRVAYSDGSDAFSTGHGAGY